MVLKRRQRKNINLQIHSRNICLGKLTGISRYAPGGAGSAPPTLFRVKVFTSREVYKGTCICKLKHSDCPSHNINVVTAKQTNVVGLDITLTQPIWHCTISGFYVKAREVWTPHGKVLVSTCESSCPDVPLNSDNYNKTIFLTTKNISRPQQSFQKFRYFCELQILAT